MTRRLIIRDAAEADIFAAAVWYQNQRDGLGGEFLAEVHSAMERAVANVRQYPLEYAESPKFAVF